MEGMIRLKGLTNIKQEPQANAEVKVRIRNRASFSCLYTEGVRVLNTRT